MNNILCNRKLKLVYNRLKLMYIDLPAFLYESEYYLLISKLTAISLIESKLFRHVPPNTNNKTMKTIQYEKAQLCESQITILNTKWKWSRAFEASFEHHVCERFEQHHMQKNDEHIDVVVRQIHAQLADDHFRIPVKHKQNCSRCASISLHHGRITHL